MWAHFRHLCSKSSSTIEVVIQSNEFWPLAIALWRFGSPLKLQLPNWEFSLGVCGGSFPHALLHSWEHEMWFSGFILARNFASLCFGYEPKARIATYFVTFMNFEEWQNNLHATKEPPTINWWTNWRAPNSFKDSNVSPKKKTTEEQGVKARSLARSPLEG
jgi:hypothetical protein